MTDSHKSSSPLPGVTAFFDEVRAHTGVSELVLARPAVIVDPVHGEQLELATTSLTRLGQLLLDVRDVESRLRELKQHVNEEIHARFDVERVWTAHTEGGLKLTGKSDAPTVEWDAEAVLLELDAMVAEGLLTAAGRDRAVQTRVEHKVLAVGINALMKSHVFAERLAPYRREVPADGRRVSVTRA